MSLTECARLVERGDPDRFRATMAAPPALRARLWPLHAANLEIARAPWASGEPLVAEMRLQWWIDTIGGIGRGGRRPGHPVAEALAPLLAEDPALAPLLVAAAEARRRDCWREPFPDAAALEAYLAATAGNPAWAAARALGAPPASEAAIRDFAWAAGLAAYLRAAAELAARGRVPFPDPRPAALAAL
ncbi:squalene/phytoene synthase family protein, partial [Albidovulum sp.]